MTAATGQWGETIGVEHVNGIPYRMYSERPRSVSDVLEFCGRWGERPYIVQDEETLTYADFRRAVTAKAAQLRSQGVTYGDRVFVLGWNSPQWVVNFWACLCAGAVPVLANTWWSRDELGVGLQALEPVLTFADSSALAKMPPGWNCASWDYPKGADLQLINKKACVANRNEEETAIIIFTSGTSGAPKAVVLSHRAILARLQMTLQITRKLPHQVKPEAHDITLITGPLFHVGSMQTLLRAIIVGDTLVLSKGRYDPLDVIRLIERHKIKRWNAVPTMVSRVLDQPDLASYDLSSLKSISIGGAPVHAELMQRMRIGLPSVSPRIPTGYGLTENGGQATAAAGSEALDQLGSTGKPLPCVEIGFLAHDGLPDGEILLRSPTQMSGYYGLDQSPIDAEGWLHTGDLGRLDEKGNLWITGRSKDMIIRGGENIAPVAVERALMTVPGVSEVVVFGIPHADLGEEVMAVVVVDDDSLTVDRLLQDIRGKVSSFAVPTRWKLQQEPLATNHTGKVDKMAISARFRQELGA
ncbi:class I adenylate-forming enzyme family protein [Rhizobium sp. CF142]|uniref:class I adenylate-forming enzyme family protein n=1 Tax=Rhizobium sp. CF142 TaxID=1144314 RepID=UPI00026EFEE0|nr:class I adenylate-forming enzyme family protein [Rhizobium sp. CF142]EJJ29268.1 acyl-CoA synthetase (AMP-forming)/AMP-acid ligase II [Rhizobium sp. CF142]